jgi:hypothetical protein
MPPTFSQQQAHSHEQNYLTYHSGYVCGPSTARVGRSSSSHWHGTLTASRNSPATSLPVMPNRRHRTTIHNPLPYASEITLVLRVSYDVQQDGFRSMTPTRFQRGHNTNWGNSMNGLNSEAAEPLRIDPPPLNGGEYTPVSDPLSFKVVPRSYFHSLKPQSQYGYFGPVGIDNTGSPFVTEPLSNPGTHVPRAFPVTSAPPSYQGASPVWRLYNSWVVYETQDELHLTIVFRKVPFT